MKIGQSEIIGTQTSFSSNFGGKLSFILSFPFPERHAKYVNYLAFGCKYINNPLAAAAAAT
jgi:hypothetical protein